MLSTMRSISKATKFQWGFTSSAKFNFSATESMQTNFVNFRKEYDQYVSNFTQKLEDVELQNSANAPKTVDSTFNHPYNSKHHPLNFSPVKTAEFFHDFVGPEQVSPHYENFLVSRKYLMAFWGGFFVLNIGSATVDLNWIMKSAFVPLIFWFSYLYFYMEGRKAFLKPLLARFYRRAAANECHMFEAYYHENIENKLRELIRITRGQLDYWQLHKNFREVKAESVNNFLANQYIGLQHHIQERAENILVQANQFEELNRSKQLSQVVKESVAVLEETMNNPAQRKEVEEDSFNRALEGISTQVMTYGQDYLLQKVLTSFQQKSSKLTSLTLEEQRQLVQLTEAQLENIRANDESARDSFVNTQPDGVDASLRQFDHVEAQLNGWGNKQ